jgi:hypothetical protein
MSNFSNAMNRSVYTENNALSLASPDPSGKVSGRLSLFFKAVRGLDEKELHKYLTEACTENLVDTCVLTFHLRDCRGGKGERSLGRTAFVWLMQNWYPEMIKLVPHIPNYGRWDDLFVLWPNVCDSTNDLLPVVRCMASQLSEDLSNMLNGKPISLCAKWAPTEGGSIDKKYNVVDALCKVLGVNKMQYRKEYIVPLRSYLKIVEKYMCEKRWDEIDFGKVPSCAMKRLKKAFEKHSKETFAEWKSKLSTGETKVNAKVLQPHELCCEVRKTGKADEVCEAQWKVILEQVKENCKLKDMLVVVDTSSSMDNWSDRTRKKDLSGFAPIDVSCALGLIVSSAVQGPFHNHVITFNEVPTFKIIPDGTLAQRWTNIKNIPWGGNTNFQAIFDMILAKGKSYGLKQEDMPKNVLVISDMQFDEANGRNTKTNFEMVEKKYLSSGYKRPNIIFWNVAAGHSDFPVSVGDNGTALISGFSPSILKSFLTGIEYNPESIMRATIDDERYDLIRKTLSGV